MRLSTLLAATAMLAAAPAWAQAPTPLGPHVVNAGQVLCADLPVEAPPVPSLLVAGGHNSTGRQSLVKGDAIVIAGGTAAGVAAGQRYVARRLRDSGYDDIDVDGLVRLQRYGITADAISALAAATARRFTVDELVTFSRYEVTADYVRGLTAVGFGDLQASDIVRLRRYEVEPEFIERLQAAGFEDLTVDKIIRLKRADG